MYLIQQFANFENVEENLNEKISSHFSVHFTVGGLKSWDYQNCRILAEKPTSLTNKIDKYTAENVCISNVCVGRRRYFFTSSIAIASWRVSNSYPPTLWKCNKKYELL